MTPLSIRPVQAQDRATIQGIVVSTGSFTPVEVATALELVDAALAEGEASGYLVYLLEDAGLPVGYVCFGPTPLTEGTWDLYWIAVQRAGQGRGYGRRLLSHAESEVERRGGRLLLIETSSQESYAATVAFYERTGYRLLARIPNFYRPGDDKLIFGKELEPGRGGNANGRKKD